jgi:predicted MFS family arabinose efflux permease
MVLRQAPDREHGSAVGILGAFYDLFVGLGSFAAGAVLDNFGDGSSFVMAAAALGLAAVVGLFWFPSKEQTPALSHSAS